MGVCLLWDSGRLHIAWGWVSLHSLRGADTPLSGPSLSHVSWVGSSFWRGSLCSEGKYPLPQPSNTIPALLRKWQIRVGVAVRLFRINAWTVASQTPTQDVNMPFSVKTLDVWSAGDAWAAAKHNNPQHKRRKTLIVWPYLVTRKQGTLMLHVFCSLNLPGRANQRVSLRIQGKKTLILWSEFKVLYIMFAQHLDILCKSVFFFFLEAVATLPKWSGFNVSGCFASRVASIKKIFRWTMPEKQQQQ